MPLVTLPRLSRRQFAMLPFGIAFAQTATPRSARWALLADTHVSQDRANTYRGFRPYDNLSKVVPQVLEAKPEGAVIDGDLARLAGMPGDYAQLKYLLEPISQKMPIAMSMGNHDDRANFLKAFTASESPQQVKGKHVVAVDAGPVQLILLDSLMNVNQTPGLLGKAQRTWLADYLKQTAQKPVLLFVHHTLDDNDGSLLDVQRLLEIMRPARQVKALIYGHSHRYHYDVLDGIHLINIPAIGYNFNDNEPVGWVDSILRTDGGDFTLRAFGGNMERHGKTVSLKWRA
jgi:3',5'-cyclic AMP phosphodiesterase CpdA